MRLRIDGSWQVRLNPSGKPLPPGASLPFPFDSGVAYAWSFGFESIFTDADEDGFDDDPHDGTFTFDIEGTTVAASTGRAFDSIFFRANADNPDTSVLFANLAIAPAGAIGGPLPSVFADANGGVPLKLLKVSPVFRDFTLTGTVTFNYADPTGLDESNFSGNILVAGTDLSDDDIDNDGFLNEEDNCPSINNPGQEDGDLDLFGDVCDNCEFVFNPQQADPDNDGFGEFCDNCPSTCTPAKRGSKSCQNFEQLDPDTDGFGSHCDNCPDKANDQADAKPQTPEGDACEDGGFGFEFVPQTQSLGGGGATMQLEAVASATGGEGASIQAAANVFNVQVVCGASNATFSNSAIRFPDIPGITADFGSLPGMPGTGCQEDLARFLEARYDCSAAQGLNPERVLATATETFGPDAIEPAGADPNVMIISAAGNYAPDGTAFTGLICEANEPAVTIGQLIINGLPDGALPSFALEALAPYGLAPLVDFDDGPVSPEALEFFAGPPDGTETFRLRTRPAIDNPAGDERLQLTLLSDATNLHQIAFCMQSPASTQLNATDMGFGGCNTPNSTLGFEVLECSANPDLGAFVDPAFPGTYVVAPNTVGRPTDIPANALCVVLTGNKLIPSEPAPNTALNEFDLDTYLGVIQLAGDAIGPRPGFRFEGVIDLPPAPTPFFTAVGDVDIPLVQVKLSDSFDSDGDSESPPDGIGNISDNCPNAFNPLQLNDGTVLAIGPNLDITGNVCTCGDGGAVNNGAVLAEDVDPCLAALAGNPESPEAGARCDVTETQGGEDLDIVDVYTLHLVTAGAAPPVDVQQVCAPATGTQQQQ